MLNTRNPTNTIHVDGADYEWTLLREPQWCSDDGWKGMLVSLRRVDERREALLEFPTPKKLLKGMPQRRRAQINDTIATNGVRAALLAGWDPGSRGKPVVFIVDAEGR